MEEGEGSDSINLGPVMGRNDLKIMGGQGGEEAAAAGWGDSDSERAINPTGGRSKAILQTTTVTVEYDHDHDQR